MQSGAPPCQMLESDRLRPCLRLSRRNRGSPHAAAHAATETAEAPCIVRLERMNPSASAKASPQNKLTTNFF